MDIASLGFSIDTSDVSKAETALDGLNKAGSKTESVAKGVGAAWSDVAGKTESASTKFRQSNEEIRGQQEELGKLLGKINPVVAALDRLDEQEKQLSGFKASGLLDAESFSEYKGRIDQARQGLAAFDAGISRTANSSKQTAQALRQLPSQFSDIFVSLQAGQNPLQVFLQQGTQIKDSFGGVGPALRESAKAAAGLVNPYTLAAAAAVAIGIAWKQGSDEAVAFNKALILTGNSAGTNAANLASMAQQLDGVVGTQRQAAAALAEVAGAGKFTEDQLLGIATAAVQMEEATGKAVSDTVAEFKRLAEDPVEASAKLNEQYNYLTASVYEQIRALQDQGREAEAQTLAIETFGAAMEQRGKEIEGSLGLIEQGWNGVKNAAAEAWDEMLSIGREATFEEKIAALQDRRRAALGGRQGGRFGNIGGEEELQRINTEENSLRLQKEYDDGIARQKGLLGEANREAISGLGLIGKAAEDAQSPIDRLQKKLVELGKAKEAAEATNSFGVNAQGDYDKAVSAINKQIAEAEARAAKKNAPKATKEAAFRDDAATKLLLSLKQQESSLSAQLTTNEKLTSEQQEQVKFEQKIADLKTKDVLTADQQSLLANEAAIRAQLEKNAAISEEVVLRKQAAEETKKLSAFQQTLADQLANAQDGINLQLAGQGMGEKESRRLEEQLRLQQQFARQQSRLQEQFNSGDISESLYSSETQALSDALDERLSMQQGYYEKLDQAQADWSNGASAAFQDYADSAKDVAGQTYDLFSNAFGGLEDVFVDFAMTGKLSFSDLANSILADLARIAARQLTANLAGGLAGSLGSGSATPNAGGGSQVGFWAGLASSFAGFFDTGGSIPAGAWGVTGERGPEIVKGPASVVSRNDTAKMMGGGSSQVFNIDLSGMKTVQEVREATAVAARNLGRVAQSAGRYM